MIITSRELLELLIQTEDNLGQNKNEFLCVCVCVYVCVCNVGLACLASC